jgi:NADH dehydrogenase
MGMEIPELHVVTGAFGFTGRYIAERLLAMGKRVRTLTDHPHRQHQFGDRISVAPYNFDNRSGLARSLEGATVLYNTYWVRFPHGEVTFERAVENSKTLIRAAEEAGVRRIVHISIANAAEDSPFPYYRAKGELERLIARSPLSHAIIRPTVLFGPESILINNIAWLLRRFPVFAVPGSGDYRLQPVFVGDVAELAVVAAQKDSDLLIDAAGPETFTFDGLVRLIAAKVGSRARIVHLAPGLALRFSRMAGEMVHDVLLTRDELEGLQAELLVSAGPPAGRTRFSEWLEQNAGKVGIDYISELERHFR